MLPDKYGSNSTSKGNASTYPEADPRLILRDDKIHEEGSEDDRYGKPYTIGCNHSVAILHRSPSLSIVSARAETPLCVMYACDVHIM